MSDVTYVIAMISIILAIIFVCFLENQAKTEKFYSYFSQYDTFYVDGIEYESKDVSKITVKMRNYGADELEIYLKDGTFIKQSEDSITFKNLEN